MAECHSLWRIVTDKAAVSDEFGERKCWNKWLNLRGPSFVTHTHTLERTCCQGDKRQQRPRPPPPCFTQWCHRLPSAPGGPLANRTKAPEGAACPSLCFFSFLFILPLSLFLSSGALSPAISFSVPLSVWLIQLGQRAAAEVEALVLSLLVKNEAD